MKRYILALAVMVVVFLGGGNVVVGEESITCSGVDNDWIDSDNGVCPSGYTLDGYGELLCCNPNPSGVAGANCMPPQGGQLNSFSRCVCPPGFKDVKGVCMDCTLTSVCCGVELNTRVPFIGKCIEDPKYGGKSSQEAFPTLMGALTQILVTMILIVSFVLIVIGGIMIATGNPSGGKKMIMKVVIGLALLGASGVILRLINPNFFG